MNDKYVLGADIGYGGLKSVGGPANFVMPIEGQGLFKKRSTAVPAHKYNGRMDGGADGYEVIVGGKPYRTCFDPARVVSTARNLGANYSTTDEYRALFHTSLLMTGRTKIDYLVTGLPMEQFKDGKTAEQIESWMTGAHEVQPGRVVTVLKTKVIAQPYGGFMEFLYRHSDGVDVETATIMVIDPGTYSVDWSVFTRLSPMTELNSSSTKASYVMLDLVASAIRRDHGVSVPVGDLESNVIEGRSSMMVGGEIVELNSYIKAAAKELVPDVMVEIMGVLKKSRTPDRVVLVGGGAMFYEEALREELGNKVVVVPKDPVSANARGFFLYGCQNMSGDD